MTIHHFVMETSSNYSAPRFLDVLIVGFQLFRQATGVRRLDHHDNGESGRKGTNGEGFLGPSGENEEKSNMLCLVH